MTIVIIYTYGLNINLSNALNSILMGSNIFRFSLNNGGNNNIIMGNNSCNYHV